MATKLLYCLIGIVALGLLVVPGYMSLPLGLFALWLVASLLPPELKVVERGVASAILLTALITLVALCGIPYQYSVSSEYAFLGICAVGLVARKRTTPCSWRLSRVDIGACILLILGCAIQFRSLGTFLQGVLPIPSRGEDTVSHLSIYLLNVQEEGLLFFRNHLTTKQVLGLLHYPQAFHYGAAVFYDALSPMLSGEKFVDAINVFVGMILFWTASIGVLVFTAAAWCVGAGRIRWTGFVLALSAIGLYVSGWISVYLSFYSFYSQIAALGFYLLMLQCSSLRTRRGWCWACIADVGIAASWFFLTPVSTVVLFFAAVRDRSLFRIREWSMLWTGSVVLKGILIGSSIAGIDSHNALVQEGGIMLPAPWVFWIFSVGGLLTFVTARIFFRKTETTLYAAALCIAAGFSGMLYLYQIYSVGQASYYFYKSVYTIALPGAVLCAYGLFEIGGFIEAAASKRNQYLVGISIAAACGIGYLFFLPAAYHFRGYTADKIHFIDRTSFKEILRLRTLPNIATTPIYSYNEDTLKAYVSDRLLPVVTGADFSAERMVLPLEAYKKGVPYEDWLYQHLLATDESRVPLIFDVKQRLRAKCERRFFELQKAGKIQIVPLRAGQWSTKKCGELKDDSDVQSSN